MSETQSTELRMTRQLLAAAHIRVQHYENALREIANGCPLPEWSERAAAALKADTAVRSS